MYLKETSFVTDLFKFFLVVFFNCKDSSLKVDAIKMTQIATYIFSTIVIFPSNCSLSFFECLWIADNWSLLESKGVKVKLKLEMFHQKSSFDSHKHSLKHKPNKTYSSLTEDSFEFCWMDVKRVLNGMKTSELKTTKLQTQYFC